MLVKFQHMFILACSCYILRWPLLVRPRQWRHGPDAPGRGPGEPGVASLEWEPHRGARPSDHERGRWTFCPEIRCQAGVGGVNLCGLAGLFWWTLVVGWGLWDAAALGPLDGYARASAGGSSVLVSGVPRPARRPSLPSAYLPFTPARAPSLGPKTPGAEFISIPRAHVPSRFVPSASPRRQLNIRAANSTSMAP